MGHAMAGRLSGTSGTVTFCECGLGFFTYTQHPMWDREKGRESLHDASMESDRKLNAHIEAMPKE